MNAAASAIGAFRLPPGRGERRCQHFGRFLLAAASPEGLDGWRSRVKPGMRLIPVRTRAEKSGHDGPGVIAVRVRADIPGRGGPRGRNGMNITNK